MARDERQLRLGQLAVDDVEIGAADAAGLDADPHLPRPGSGSGSSVSRSGLPGMSSTIARMNRSVHAIAVAALTALVVAAVGGTAR